ncbi:hypothetical protein U9M48_023092, partial [Paspalum notatum var. saurae]
KTAILRAQASDTIAYTTVLKGLCSVERWEDAEELIAEMFCCDCPPDEVTFNTVIASLCQKGLVDRAIKVVEQMSENGCNPDVVTYNCIIGGLCNERCVDDAMELLSNLQSCGCKPDIGVDRWEDAEQLMVDMMHNNCPPDEMTLNTVITSLYQE